MKYNDYDTEHVKIKWSKYLTKQKKINPLIRKVLEYSKLYNFNINIIIDLGCGSGNESNFLINKGFNVIAVDYNLNCELVILKKYPELKNNSKFTFINERIENLNIKNKKFDVIVALNSIPFINRKKFSKFMKSLLSTKINTKGLFVGSFFGIDDEWNDIIKISKSDLLLYFKNYKILYISETHFSTKLVNNSIKKSHTISIIALKE